VGGGASGWDGWAINRGRGWTVITSNLARQKKGRNSNRNAWEGRGGEGRGHGGVHRIVYNQRVIYMLRNHEGEGRIKSRDGQRGHLRAIHGSSGIRTAG